MLKPLEIVNKMIHNDAFSKWLGIEILDVKNVIASIILVDDLRIQKD